MEKTRGVITSEKVLEEMQKAEEYVKSWQANWSEYEKSSDEIEWVGMDSHTSTRNFTFSNDGQITLSKSSHIDHCSLLSYDASFNVFTDDFKIEFSNKRYWDPFLETVSIDLTNDILTTISQGIEIKNDLNTGDKFLRIAKEHHKVFISLEIAFNSLGGFEKVSLVINTYKGTGKINGIYRFDMSNNKRLRAYFYSRGGVKFDLATNPQLLEKACNLLLPNHDQLNSGDLIILDLAEYFKNVIAAKQDPLNFDYTAINFDYLKQMEGKAMDLVKGIKGELPLYGLVERIDKCLDRISKQNIIDESKVLKRCYSETQI